MKLFFLGLLLLGQARIVTEIRSQAPDGYEDYDELDCEDEHYETGCELIQCTD